MTVWRLVRWLVAALLLLWSGSPAFRAPIDDLYITTAFAHELAREGRLQWTTGEVVEGVTSIPWTVFTAIGPLVEVDAAFWARLGSVAVGVLFLGALSRRAAPGIGGTLLLWVTAAWSSFSLWALSGFEMTLFAGLVALGWTHVVERRWWPGIVALVLAGLVRPEGWALALAAAALAWNGSRSFRPVAAVSGALAAWVAARFLVFGALLPTPFLVKFVANPNTLAGVAQVAGDLVVAAGPLCVVAIAARCGPRAPVAIAAVPLALGVALLAKSDGDWFASGRMTAAGVLALVYAIAPRFSVGVPTALVLAGCGLLSAFTRAPYGYTLVENDLAALPDRLRLRRVSLVDAYASGFSTPLLQELAWVARSIAPGDCLLTADVGILGNVDGVCIRDRVGLVDRAFAEFNAKLGPDPRGLPGAARITAERVIWREEAPAVPGMELDARYPSTPPGGWSLDFLRRPDASRPAPAVVAERWKTLAQRYPWQPDLWWGWGVFAHEAGVRDPVSTIRENAWRWPRHPLAREPDALLSFADTVFLRDDYVPGRGFRIEKSGERRSRPVREDEALSLDLDTDGGPVTLLVGWSGDGCPLARSAVTSSKGAFALPVAPCPTARISVWYVDDGTGASDKNVYVRLRPQRPGDPALPAPTRDDVPLEGDPAAEWIAGRGWAMWWNRAFRSPVLPAGTRVELTFDVDGPGDEGAHATLAWEPACAENTRVVVREAGHVEQRSAPCEARLSVRFENDGAAPADRNLYVRARTLQASAPHSGTGIVTTPPAFVPPPSSSAPPSAMSPDPSPSTSPTREARSP